MSYSDSLKKDILSVSYVANCLIIMLSEFGVAVNEVLGGTFRHKKMKTAAERGILNNGDVQGTYSTSNIIRTSKRGEWDGIDCQYPMWSCKRHNKTAVRKPKGLRQFYCDVHMWLIFYWTLWNGTRSGGLNSIDSR